MAEPILPVRLCCGEHHLGPVCPDGKVMCCLCFRRVGQDELHQDEDGKLEDVCKICALQEELVGRLREAWSLLNTLHMEVMDKGESWPRALEWLERNKHFKP